jgi:hypothetical protein
MILFQNCVRQSRSHQDGRHSAVALLLKAALIQVSDYRLLEASGSFGHYVVLFFDIRILITPLVSSESP